MGLSDDASIIFSESDYSIHKMFGLLFDEISSQQNMAFMHSNHSFFFNVESDKFEIIWTDFFMLPRQREETSGTKSRRLVIYNIV